MAEAPLESHARAHASYRSYWLAWLVLLALTVTMVSIGSPGILLAGIAIKAGIIALWFMHLKDERLDLTLIVILSILVSGLVLFGLIAPDGRAM